MHWTLKDVIFFRFSVSERGLKSKTGFSGREFFTPLSVFAPFSNLLSCSRCLRSRLTLLSKLLQLQPFMLLCAATLYSGLIVLFCHAWYNCCHMMSDPSRHYLFPPLGSEASDKSRCHSCHSCDFIIKFQRHILNHISRLIYVEHLLISISLSLFI